MEGKPFVIVAVDGGAASGKSSTSRAISQRFNFLHVDTGSFYRAVTYKLLEAGVTPLAVESIGPAISKLRPGTLVDGRSARMEIDGWIPGDEIRSAAVNENVSKFAALPVVRKFLLDYQRDQARVARSGGFAGLVMEGRDIGSVIFPDADLRIFLEASAESRTQRRAAEGQVDRIHERDRLDTQRKASPLVCPPGAIPIDSTHLSLEQVVEKVAALVSEKLGA
ncbi:MAG TPA: (d)CMP kinase [Opitutaceae bacterium]